MHDVYDRIRAGLRSYGLADSIQSEVTRLGMLGPGGDKTRDVRPAVPAWLYPQEIDNGTIVEGILRRVIYGFPGDALRGGWRSDTEGSVDVTRKLDKRLGLRTTAKQVAALARQYGGCYCWKVIEGIKDLRLPLPPGPHKILRLHPLAQLECVALTWDNDPKSATFTQALTFTVTLIRPGISVNVGTVHRSHLIYMPGLAKSPSQFLPLTLGYDVSAAQVYWEVCAVIGIAKRAAAVALMEQSMVVLSIKSGATALAGDDEAAVRDGIELWGESRSTLGTSVVVGDDTATRLEAPLAGLADGVRVQYEALSCIEGRSQTSLLGMSPPGLSTNDEAGRRMDSAWIVEFRDDRLTPFLIEIYRCELGDDVADDIEIHWPDPDPPTEKERAEISAIYANRDAALVSIQAITGEESRGRFDGDEELEMPVLLALPPVIPEPEPDDEPGA